LFGRCGHGASPAGHLGPAAEPGGSLRQELGRALSQAGLREPGAAARLPAPAAGASAARLHAAAARSHAASARPPADHGLAAGMLAVHGDLLWAGAARALPVLRDAADLPGARHAAGDTVAARRAGGGAGAAAAGDLEWPGALGRRRADGDQALAAA